MNRNGNLIVNSTIIQLFIRSIGSGNIVLTGNEESPYSYMIIEEL